MVSSSFNVPVSTQGAHIPHIGSVHHVSPGYASSSLSQSGGNGFFYPAGATHVSSTPTAPTTYVDTSSQWPITVDGACGDPSSIQLHSQAPSPFVSAKPSSTSQQLDAGLMSGAGVQPAHGVQNGGVGIHIESTPQDY
ncbi:hypothetical protein V6N11_044456 [Hibiscus sabdariffa]|uniref:Uncharacterized protein n=1 Tax=Hibiscus sabdariffa TaxID=183260 RepID=A0ABR2RF78_9ROSI